MSSTQGGKPAKPGMVKVTDNSGSTVDLEIWELEVSNTLHSPRLLPALRSGTSRAPGKFNLSMQNSAQTLVEACTALLLPHLCCPSIAILENSGFLEAEVLWTH